MAIPVFPQCRVIVDNDYSGDPDGLVALAHHLLSPSNRVVGITSSFVNPKAPTLKPTAKDGAQLAQELLDVLGLPQLPEVHSGSEAPFGDRGASSPASAAIVAEARREDDLPLYVACGGPLTNVAAALQEAPDIAERMTLVWIGGSRNGAGYEYNEDTDRIAKEFVFAHNGLAVRQFPVEAYRQCMYSVSELEQDVASSGLLGRWLVEQFTSPPDWIRIGGVWPLGDSPTLLVSALSDESSSYEVVNNDDGGAERVVYTRVDARLIFDDMLAKFRRQEDNRRGGRA